MQAVSQEYKDSMKALLRDRGYMRVEIGHVNEAPQKNAVITGEQVDYSNPSKVFEGGIDTGFTYATLEENFTKVDGSKYFLTDYPADYKEMAFISEDLITDGNPYQLEISFGGTIVTFDKIVFNFGENYPTSFTITDSNGSTYSFTNLEPICEINQDFEDVSSITLTIMSMVKPNTRLRIYSINFDYGFAYENDMILDSNLETSMSPINAELPQMNFDLQLVNEDHYFDVDNPKSIVDQFSTAVEVKVFYGYQLTDQVEWIQAAKLHVSSWETDQDKFNLSCKDILQINDQIYPFGSTSSTTLYDLATDVFSVMGVTEYDMDPDLDAITTVNPMPPVTCKEALQIIANAGRKRLYLRRDGVIKIGEGSNVIDITSNGTLPYSDAGNIEADDTKYDYVTLENNYTKADGSQYFVTAYSGSYLHTGYVCDQMSNEAGLFSTFRGSDVTLSEPVIRGSIINLPYTFTPPQGESQSEEPKITMELSTPIMSTGLNIHFGDTYAIYFTVNCYSGSLLTMSQTFSNAVKNCSLSWSSVIADKIEIIFIQTAQPYQRVRINYIEVLTGKGSFTFEGNDIMTYPKFSRAEKIHKIVIPYKNYKGIQDEETLLEESVTVTDTDEEFVYTVREPVKYYRCSVTSGLARIVRYCAYSVTVKFTTTGSKTLTIYGNRYNVTEQEVEEVVNTEGTILRWENPLVSSKEMAEDLLAWLKEYYILDGYYEFDTRGNPELDVNDEVFLETYFGDRKEVLITDLSLSFNGAFAGSVKVLKKGAVS